MKYSHSFDQANDYACEALERMQREGVPATPDHYELWYVYYSRLNSDVVRAIDVLAAAHQQVNAEQCTEIYDRFLSEGRNEEAIREAGNQIQATIKNVTTVVRDVKDATSEYSGALQTVSTTLESTDDPKQLQSALKHVVTDTRKMLERNQQLEDQLTRSALAMEEMQRHLESIRREALTDGLTGLSNRKAFDTELVRVAEETQAQEGSVFTLLMVDIDHFKSFNDNFGHQVGDQVIRLVARTLTEGVKGRDIAARYGGEEFAIILPGTGIHAGVAVAESLRKALANKDIINRSSGDKLGRITMSVGVAEYYHGEDLEDLIERADSALYTAKHNGRNQVAAAPSPSRRK